MYRLPRKRRVSRSRDRPIFHPISNFPLYKSRGDHEKRVTVESEDQAERSSQEASRRSSERNENPDDSTAISPHAKSERYAIYVS